MSFYRFFFCRLRASPEPSSSSLHIALLPWLARYPYFGRDADSQLWLSSHAPIKHDIFASNVKKDASTNEQILIFAYIIQQKMRSTNNFGYPMFIGAPTLVATNRHAGTGSSHTNLQK